MEQKLRRDRCMGDNLRRLRNQAGLSQEKLCAELQRRGCDIGRTTYAKYESGELNIRVSVLMELRDIYGCSYDEFFADLQKQLRTRDEVYAAVLYLTISKRTSRQRCHRVSARELPPEAQSWGCKRNSRSRWGTG